MRPTTKRQSQIEEEESVGGDIQVCTDIRVHVGEKGEGSAWGTRVGTKEWRAGSSTDTLVKESG